MGERGVPQFIRSDNGPEFIAKEVQSWLAEMGIGMIYIDLGGPWQNGHVESFHNRLRDEYLILKRPGNSSDHRRMAIILQSNPSPQQIVLPKP